MKLSGSKFVMGAQKANSVRSTHRRLAKSVKCSAFAAKLHPVNIPRLPSRLTAPNRPPCAAPVHCYSIGKPAVRRPLLMHRRNFFQLALGAGAVAAASAAVSGRTPEDVATDEDYWSEIRSAFSIDRNFINLNNGYVSPSPRTVQDAMRRYLDYSDMGPYPTMVNVLYREIEAVRRRLAQYAGCDPEEIAITRNSSEALENAQYGIDLKPGDEVLTTNQDYPRMIETFKQRERRDGIDLKPGDEVLTTNQDYPRMIEPYKQRERRDGIDLKPGDEVLTTNQDYPRMIETFKQRERRDGIDHAG